MSWLIVVAWFVCGLAGVHIVGAMNTAEGCQQEGPGFCWSSLLGPAVLFIVVFVCVQEAVTKKVGR